jgi:hypothetical protein
MSSAGTGRTRFKPLPNDRITLFGEEFVFQEHPGTPGLPMPFASTGGRATVYQVKDLKGTPFGLKVFDRAFRQPRVAESCVKLRRLASFEGLTAAERRCVEPGSPILQVYPNLEYAVLMPWLPGQTWADILLGASRGGAPYDRNTAIQLCLRFLKVLKNLEANNIAHTDISAGNVMFRRPSNQTELLDLEDVYMVGAQEPEQIHKTFGTPNYQHARKQDTWRPTGDRYAAAVLASEILVLSNDDIARSVTEIGAYQGNFESPEAHQRFEGASRWLAREAPTFSSMLQRAWMAKSLDECPSISELEQSISELQQGHDGDWKPGGSAPPFDEPPPEVVTPGGAPWEWVQTGISWEKPSLKSLPSAATSNAKSGATSVLGQNDTSTKVSGPTHRKRHRSLIVIIIIAILILVAIFLLHRFPL